MNEILLVVAFAVVMVGGAYYTSRITRPARTYMRIGCSLVLIAMAWLVASNGSRQNSWFLTAVAVSVILGELWELRKPKAKRIQ
ncbi:hypothetical protein [Flaviaesturariibacter aridisoli]|uniref:Uncharacterized protein n=1 Tax=Flaviaesturariibacter aridisoli TaxID=2545761 RepID=A0A4R4DTH9_9BACT|nr:hypothetical protein [Flaviaesturariibacter aridisoli]TCZ63411.1 hypothetical protein E0486_18620 [Flaviaesturariibacter aridisoli]